MIGVEYDLFGFTVVVLMGAALIFSGMAAGYRLSWIVGINPGIGTYVGLIVAVAYGVHWFIS